MDLRSSLLRRTLAISCIIGLYTSASFAQFLSEQISYNIIPSCESPTPDKPTGQGQYFIQLNIDQLIASEEDIEIIVDNKSQLQLHVERSDIPLQRFIGPFTHSGVGGTYQEFVMRSLSSGMADTLYIPELVCGFLTSNGLNSAGYFCDNGTYGVVAQMSPETLDLPEFPEKTYLYILAERLTNIVVDRNFSGLFANLDDLSRYEMHAFAIPFEEQASFINQVIIGETFDQEQFNICYATCGVFEVAVDCNSFDLSLSKSVRGEFVYEIGDTVVFDITVVNDGTVTAYDIEVTDMLPNALDFLPALNPSWRNEMISYPIDSLQPGEQTLLEITVRVNNTSLNQEIINLAEIAFATDMPDKGSPAFDVDSTPDNENQGEDDIDGAEITILQNLCAATFAISAENDAVCLNGALSMSADLLMMTPPVRYLWRFEGEVVSREETYVIEDHRPSDYGVYSLTIVDGNGCTGTEFVNIQPIDNQERFSCFDDVYVGVDRNCEIRLNADMFTSREVTGIRDYDLEIRDQDGNLVDQGDLSQYRPGTVLEVRVINPCTQELICWSNLHIESKLDPLVNIYGSDQREMPCTLVKDKDPSAIIARYNELFGDVIMDAAIFADSFNQLVCLQEWEVDIIDQLLLSEDCDDQIVRRVYNVFDQERRIAIDSVEIALVPLDLAEVRLPADLSNLSCIDELRPVDLNSFPSYTINGQEVSLDNLLSDVGDNALCNIALTYTDQALSGGCNYGVSRVVRTWAISDWCSNQTLSGVQHLFVVDKDPPEVLVDQDVIRLTTAPFACFATLVFSNYLSITDLCSSNPYFLVGEEQEQLDRLTLPIGQHDIQLTAVDECDNSVPFSLSVIVTDDQPPIAIINEDIVLAITQDTGLWTNFVTSEMMDEGSHDHDCGPVEITIARSAEVAAINSAGGSIELGGYLFNCDDITTDEDENEDNRISVEEVYRDRIVFCCSDIDQDVSLSVKVVDGSGNVSIVEGQVSIQGKLAFTSCDDANPCTIDDRQYGECPCSGTPDLRDIDQDGILDCSDSSISLCLQGVTITATHEELDDLLAAGAVGGACEEEAMASLSGHVYTPSNDMIQGVAINNENRQEVTSVEGSYLFEENEMFNNYTLTPSLDQDYLNGVSVTDLVILEDYILGFRPLDDPYLRIAADVNNDGRISALDLQELRLLLLGHTDVFTNQSWRFVVADYVFPDERKPFDFTEDIVINNLQKNLYDLDWIGVKIGDINNSAIPNSTKSRIRTKDFVDISMPDLTVHEGDRIDVPLYVDKELFGLQVSLDLDGLEIEGVEGLSPQFYHLDKSASKIRIVYHSESELPQASIVLQVKSNLHGQLSELITLGYDRIPEVVYGDLSIASVHLSFDKGIELSEKAREASLYQNQPNPFTGETVIQFEIPRAGEVAISFFSSSGQLIYSVTDVYGLGVNAIQLSRSDLQLLDGIIFYRMAYEGQVVTRRMVIHDGR